MKKRLFNILIVAVFFALLMSVRIFAYTGCGTEEEPYIILCYDDFYSLAEVVKNGDSEVASAYIKLGASIDFSGKSFLPIGTADNPFKGSFDGDGYSLNDITYSTANASSGVFAYAENAVIKNLGVVDAVFNLAGIKDSFTCGVICGNYLKTEKNSDNSFENCRASGKITIAAPNASYAYAGGIAGLINSSVSAANIMVENCESSCDITVRANAAYCGGFAGYVGADKSSATVVEIKYLYTTKGTLTALSGSGNAYCGGLIGYLKAEEAGWGEWMSEGEVAVLSDTSYALSNSISLCTVNAESASASAYASYTVSQTEAGPKASKLYCTGTDNSSGGIKGTTVSESNATSSSFLRNTLGFDLENVWSLDGGLGLIEKNAVCGSVSDEGKTFHVRANGYIDGYVIVAAYDGDGRVLQVKIKKYCGRDCEFSESFTASPESIRVFAMGGGSLLPACPNLTLDNITNS